MAPLVTTIGAPTAGNAVNGAHQTLLEGHQQACGDEDACPSTITLPERALALLHPRFQGHQTNANTLFREPFAEENTEIVEYFAKQRDEEQLKEDLCCGLSSVCRDRWSELLRGQVD